VTILHTIDPPNPGAPVQSLLRAALVITHNSNGELETAVNGEGAGSDNAADGAEEMRWANGLEFQPYSCADAIVVDPCAASGYGSTDDDNNRPQVRPYLPFAVDAHDKCSTFGWQAADYERRARTLLAQRESKAVAKEFWTGTLEPTNPHLADGADAAGFGAPTAVGAALSPRAGLSLLVQALADGNGEPGMIHMRPRLLQYLASIGAARYEGGKWYTATGAIIVADAGYPGTGPTGQAITNVAGAITEWAFATDLVEVHRGPVDVFSKTLSYQSTAHQTNDEVVRATRLYAPIWNGCVLAAASITTPISDE
jgi:hypothetical protein